MIFYFYSISFLFLYENRTDIIATGTRKPYNRHCQTERIKPWSWSIICWVVPCIWLTNCGGQIWPGYLLCSPKAPLTYPINILDSTPATEMLRHYAFLSYEISFCFLPHIILKKKKLKKYLSSEVADIVTCQRIDKKVVYFLVLFSVQLDFRQIWSQNISNLSDIQNSLLVRNKFSFQASGRRYDQLTTILLKIFHKTNTILIIFQKLLKILKN